MYGGATPFSAAAINGIQATESLEMAALYFYTSSMIEPHWNLILHRLHNHLYDDVFGPTIKAKSAWLGLQLIYGVPGTGAVSRATIISMG
jgi:hypothetical protein